MAEAAQILKGQHVAKGVRAIIIPATQEIYKQCIQLGYTEIFIDAGCVVSTPTCGPCLGGYMGILAENERCVATTNRNFVGRMGHVAVSYTHLDVYKRQGKTLNMNMLYYFFSLKQKENAYLFDGLHITKDAEILRYQNQYPVIFITLKDMKQVSFENQKAMFAILIQEIVRNNKELLDSEEVSTFDKEQLVAYSRRTQSDVDLQLSLIHI